MKLHNLLYGIAFVTGVLSIAGADGVMTYGTGLMTCVVLLAVCVISAVAGMYEDGILRKKNRP